MARTWVLDTETKGTGAEMVPLERALEQKRAGRGISLLRRRRAARPRQEPEHAPVPTPAPAPLRSRQFKLISAISCRVLAEGVGVRETVDLLARARSLVDVRVYARDSAAGEWRPLTLHETRLLRGYAR